MVRRSSTLVLVLVLIVGALASCATTTDSAPPPNASSATSTAPATSAAPASPGTSAPHPLTFYRPPTALSGGRPGDVITTSPTTIDPSWPGVASRLTFVSTTPAGDLVPVTGVVITPTAPRPAEGYPIVVWAHGTVGLGDPCAPSRYEPFQASGAKDFLAAGYLVVAPDYEGLGIEGETHPYLVGEATGNNILDSARAGAAFGGGARVAIFGASQGGHASLFARQLAASYAPELDVVGVVAAAPVTDPATFLLPGRHDPNIFPFTAEAILAWTEVYHEPQLDDLVVVQDAEAVRLARSEWCTGELLPDKPLDEIFLAEPQNLPVWQQATDVNDPSAAKVDIPVLLTHGDADTIVPIDGTTRFHDALCANGEAVVFLRDPAWVHPAAWTLPLPDIVRWIADRIDGVAAPSDCA